MTLLSTDKTTGVNLEEGILVSCASFTEGLEGPLSLAIDKNSYLLVTEEFGHRMKKFDHNFTCVWSIGLRGNKEREFFYPTDITVDTKNNYYVTDRWNHRVQKFDENGNFILQFGSYGSQKGQFNEPWGIGLLPSNYILVVDRGNARLVIFDEFGRFITNFGRYGTSIDFYESERFKRNFHFKNWLNNVHKLNTIESRFYEFKYDVGELEYPEDVSIDTEGNIYVTDRVGGCLIVFDKTFSLKTILSDCGSIPIPQEPSAVYAYEGGYFIAGESTDVLYWYHDNKIILFDMKKLGIRVSNIHYEKDKNLLYVIDTWNNAIYMFSIRGSE